MVRKLSRKVVRFLILASVSNTCLLSDTSSFSPHRGRVCSSRMWRRGEDHAQSFSIVVACSGSLAGTEHSGSGAASQRRRFRTMGGEYGFLRNDDLLSDGAEAGGR